ncbi:MAG: hypothetical protein QXY68_01450 [Saccharolobus sp.]
MRSFLGTLSSLQEAAIYYYGNDFIEAQKALQEAKKAYKGLRIKLLNLSNIGERIEVIDIDPDIGERNRGYVVIIEVPQDLYA